MFKIWYRNCMSFLFSFKTRFGHIPMRNLPHKSNSTSSGMDFVLLFFSDFIIGRASIFTGFSSFGISPNSSESRYSSLSNSWISSELPFFWNSSAARSIWVSIHCCDFARPIIKSINYLFSRSLFVLLSVSSGSLSTFHYLSNVDLSHFLLQIQPRASPLGGIPFLLANFTCCPLNWRVSQFRAIFPRYYVPRNNPK